MRRVFVCLSLLVAATIAACGPSAPDTGDDDPPGSPDAAPEPDDECSAGETRCSSNRYQTCVDGSFETQETCDRQCVRDVGCRDCDPAQGNTCNGNAVVTCEDDGSFGDTVTTCGTGTECVGGRCGRSCTADGIDLIYVVDRQNNLRSFDPRLVGTGTDPFALIGPMSCPAGPGIDPLLGRGPFGMSIDRNGVAWVLYTSGEIFKVSIHDASCQNSGYRARQGSMNLFGMGFVADTAGSDSETIFIGGGNTNAQAGNRKFATINPTTLALTPIGPLASPTGYTPELSGTGNGELFGFFPGSLRAYVQQLDKATGAPVGPELTFQGGLGALVEAWGFAHWGGTFYVFVTSGADNSTVRTVDRDGNYQLLLQRLPFNIVGAGVSTCAPTDVD
jgi:hypothetical protein